jgi:PAS domain S-box-containing protein
MDHRFKRNLQLGYGFSFFMLLAVGLLSYFYVNNLLASNREVTHSNSVIGGLERTISLMKDAETGQRGYLLTGREEFLEPYRGAYGQAMAALDKVTALSSDNGRQQQNMAAIRQVMQQRLTILRQLIDRRKNGGTVSPADFDAGKAAMDALRRTVDKAEFDEQYLLKQRSLVLSRYTFWTPILIITAIILALLITIASYINVMNDVREKDSLRNELAEKEQETAAFNEELTAANEEITAAVEELTSINEELREAREELAVVNESLEEKVASRTRALQESEEETQALNEELMAINEELASANEEYQATNEELLQARDQMEKSGHLFRAIARNIPGSLVMVIGPDHRVLTLEGDLLEQLNYQSGNPQGKHLSEVTSPERYEASLALYERLLAGEQFRMNRKGESGADFQVDFVPLRNEAANVYAGLIIALDITDLKQAEERSAKLAAIVESSDDAIISKTLEGVITSWNRGAQRIFGYTESEMVGASIFQLIPEEKQDEEPQILARLKQGELVENYETMRVTSDGRLVDISLTISPIRDKTGAITGISKIGRDISERKQDEQRKNDFIGMVSHELKTPLTSLTALIQVAGSKLKNNDDPFLTGAMDKAGVQVRKMSNMINGFLNVSRLESGKIQIEKRRFSLPDLVTEMIGEARLTVSTHVFQFEPGAELTVDADYDKIGSVISNLLSNAVKYSPKGKQITISCTLFNGEALVSVADEGMGIKPQDLAKLFERYYRVETPHTRHISGFGIGLYLSAEIIGRHEGRIWAESEKAVGSTFFFSLPAGD